MAFTITTQLLGAQPIAETSTTRRHPLGTIVEGTDPTLGAGEFIYLLGLAGTVAGLGVTYTARTGVTALGTTSGVVEGGAPFAVAMSANVANQYGWYQIGGDTTVLKTAVAITPATVKVYLSATAGRLMPTSVAGRQILGARWGHVTTVTSTTSTAIITLNRPSLKTGTLV